MLDVPEGLSVWEGVSTAFLRHDIHCAHLDLMGAHLRSAIFYTGSPDPAGKWIAQYGAPNHTGHVLLVSAMGIYGKDRQDNPMLHCHGCIVTDTGQTQGGHLDTNQCVVGHTGLRIYVTATRDVGFAARLDSTSGMFVFHPQYVEGHEDGCEDTAERTVGAD